MATKIHMRHPKTGIVKDGFSGFSWTTFLFGPIPVWLRGDFLLGCAGLLGPFSAFVINQWYTARLIKKGYEFAAAGTENEYRGFDDKRDTENLDCEISPKPDENQDETVTDEASPIVSSEEEDNQKKNEEEEEEEEEDDD